MMDGLVMEIVLMGYMKWWWSGGEEVLFEDGDVVVGFGVGRVLGFVEGGGRFFYWVVGFYWGFVG